MKPVQILMPAYNTASYITEAVDSLLEQREANVELLILDDASSDETFEILRSYERTDRRVRLIRNKQNMGIIRSRQILLEAATAEYVAIQDSDDVSLPFRIKKQVDFLNLHPRIIAVGSAAEFIGTRKGYWRPPLNDSDIRATLTLRNPLPNSSMMFRRPAIVERGIRYDERLSSAEDFDFWVQMSKAGEIAVLPDVLVKYRVHEAQETSVQRERQDTNAAQIVAWELKKRGLNAEVELLRCLINPGKYVNPQIDVKRIGHIITQAIRVYADSELSYSTLYATWDHTYRGVCRRMSAAGLLAYLRTRGVRNLMTGKAMGIGFAVDCFFRNR